MNTYLSKKTDGKFLISFTTHFGQNKSLFCVLNTRTENLILTKTWEYFICNIVTERRTETKILCMNRNLPMYIFFVSLLFLTCTLIRFIALVMLIQLNKNTHTDVHVHRRPWSDDSIPYMKKIYKIYFKINFI